MPKALHRKPRFNSPQPTLGMLHISWNIEHLDLGCYRRKILATTKAAAAAIPTDRVGKAFIAVGQDVRQCLVCEQLFMRRDARVHARVACGAPGTQLCLRYMKGQACSAVDAAWQGHE
jgi:hypothetical protein